MLAPLGRFAAVAGALACIACTACGCGPASTRSLVEQHQLGDAISAARDRPAEREAAIDGVVQALRPRIFVEVMPGDAVAKALGPDAPLLAERAVVKVRVAYDAVRELSVRATWTWNGGEPASTTLYALASLTGEKHELSTAEKLADLGRATALVASCGLTVGTVCPASALRQSNASKQAPTEATAPVAARMARALDGHGYALVTMKTQDEPVRLTVELDVDAVTCETPPCGELRLAATMDVERSSRPLAERFAAVFVGGERPFARDHVTVRP